MKGKTEINVVYGPFNKEEEKEGKTAVGGMHDSTVQPVYYRSGNGTFDVIDFCMALDIPFAEGNVIKYIVRHKQKGGLDDLKKAVEYIDRIARAQYGKSIKE